MKATGEVMGIGSSLEECLLKSVRCLETGASHFWLSKFADKSEQELIDYLYDYKDDSIFAVTRAAPDRNISFKASRNNKNYILFP